ncbi:MAG: YbjN domain-containing protein [Chloroflexota bacterium]|nr:YbjN domain-containing protein [Chloroflexota bacterium]
MPRMMDLVSRVLEENEWPFPQTEQEGIVQTTFQGENGQWTCYAFATEEQQRLVFYSVCPVHAPQTSQQAVAELIARINYGLVTGNFEFDFDDGEICFKTSVDCSGVDGEDDNLIMALVEPIVFTNVVIMDMFLPAILKVIYGDMSPEQALAEIRESGLDEENLRDS